MNKRVPILLGLLLVIVAVWMLVTSGVFVRSIIHRLDDLGYDLQLKTRILTNKNPALAPVAIIDIDNKSLKALGRWPWQRSVLAQLVTNLTNAGAAVIAFDVFFSEKQPNIAAEVLEKFDQSKLLTPEVSQVLKNNLSRFDEDIVLAKSFSTNTVVLAIGFLPQKQTQNILPPPLLTLTPIQDSQLNLLESEGYISNIPILQNASKGSGFINILPDEDGIIRHAPLLFVYRDKVYPSLALQTVLAYLNLPVSLITPTYHKTIQMEGIQLGSNQIPTDARGQVYVPFIGKSYTFPYFSAIDVVKGNIPKDALLGKIVFIGTSATGLGDLVPTAIENPFPGVEIQATLVNGMLQNNFSYKPEWTIGANLFFTIVLGIIGAFLFPYCGPRTLALIIIVIPPLLLFLNNIIWEETGLILSFLVPAILIIVSGFLNMIYGYLFETRRREQLKGMFGQYVPATHIDEMLKSSADYGLRGEDRDMSVIFADIRNFTTISEDMSAKELVDMLNTIFTPMTEIIFNHKGTIDKYIGDLIMAFWGAPLNDKGHARHAIQSALEMQKKIADMQSLIAERKWPEIKMGIGINSGMMSVGDMGSRFRRNYTVLGDAVNLASRVEGLTKFYGVDIIVTENTVMNQHKYIFRQLDRVRVKGKKLGVEIYEVIGTKAELTPELEQELAVYHQALQDYFNQRWDEATTLLTELHRLHPERKIYRIYLERIQEMKSQSLAADWDGIYVHSSK